MREWSPLFWLLSAVALAATAAMAQEQAVMNTLHNLSSSGPGEVRSLTESEVCKFCHIPHNSQSAEALWSQPLSQADYLTPQLTTESSLTLESPQPDGTSRLCLSCHDGTIAMGDFSSTGSGRSNAAGANRLAAGRPGFIGTDLSGSHPVSFVVPEMALEATGSRDIGLKSLPQIQADDQVKLDARGKMQCTTCHDPHSDANYQPGQVPHFWVKPTVEGVCLTCHELR